MSVRRLGLVAALLVGCGGAASSGETEPERVTPNPPPALGSTPGCTATTYRPPAGCFVDTNLVYDRALGSGGSTMITDGESLASILGAYPPELNRGDCDPSAAAAAFDFTASRVWAVQVDSIGEMLTPLEPTRVDCSSDEAIRVHIEVDAWCGGTEVAFGWMILTLPADARPPELVNDGNPRCPPGPRPP